MAAVQDHFRIDILDPGKQSVPQFTEALVFLIFTLQAKFRRPGETNDQGYSQGSGTKPPLMPAAFHLHLQFHLGIFLARKKESDPFWAIQLMRCGCQQINIHCFYVQIQFSKRLAGIHHKKYILPTANGADLLHRLDSPDLVVGVHDGNQDSVPGYGLRYRLWIDKTLGIHWQ